MKCNTACPLSSNDRSLYDDRIYDEHENHIRCYEKNPVQVVEKFQMPTDKKMMIKWILVILVLAAIIGGVYYYVYHCKTEVVKIDFNPVQNGGYMTSSPPFTL